MQHASEGVVDLYWIHFVCMVTEILVHFLDWI